MIRENLPEKVDLFTGSKRLDDIILNEYPGTIFEEQHKIDEDSDGKVYQFFGLDYPELKRFLANYNQYEYEIRDMDGNFVEVNDV